MIKEMVGYSKWFTIRSWIHDILFEMDHDEPEFWPYCWIGSIAWEKLLRNTNLTENELMRVLNKYHDIKWEA